MSVISSTFDRAWPGFPFNMSAGQTISVDVPNGFALLRNVGDGWQQITAPYTASEDCLVRLDCDEYPGSPITVTMEVA